MKRRRFLQLASLTPLTGSLPAWAKGNAPPIAGGSVIAGRFGKLPAPGAIQRVISAGAPADAFLLSLAPQKLLGLSTLRFREQSRQFLPEAYRDLPEIGRISGRGSTLPMEKLLALRPDVIIDIGNASIGNGSGVNDSYLSTAERVTQQTGIPCVVVHGKLGDTAQQLRELGAILGVDERAHTLATFAERILQQAAQIRQASAGQRVRVYYGRGAEGLETGLAGSIHTEALELAGAENVAAAAGAERVVRVSMEQLLLWKPDVILTQDSHFHHTLQQGQGIWSQLDAVRNRRFHRIPNLPFGWMDVPPTLNRLLGLILLPHLLYPQLVRHDWRAQIREYFRLYYGYALDDDGLDKLLNMR